MRDFFVGCVVGLVLIAAAVVVIAIAGNLELAVSVNAKTLRRAVEVTILLLCGALLEELMFRGYPFQKLIESVGAVGAIALFSILFGAAHLDNPNASGVLSWGMLNTIAVGVLFAVAYLRRGTLWLPVGLHFAWNWSLGLLFGLPVSGMRDFAVVVRSRADGPRLLTGGAYGLEGSVTGVIVILIGLALIWALPKNAPTEESAVTNISPAESSIERT